jgi:hypothetical protein
VHNSPRSSTFCIVTSDCGHKDGERLAGERQLNGVWFALEDSVLEAGFSLHHKRLPVESEPCGIHDEVLRAAVSGFGKAGDLDRLRIILCYLRGNISP